MDWVRERNAHSLGVLRAQPMFEPIKQQVLSHLSATDKIPYVFALGDRLYNLWTDGRNKRGLLRRTSLAAYQSATPAWDTVLDLDALGAAENENWVYKGMSCLAPSYARCLVLLSRGGADAVVVREFDALAMRFVPNGFTTPEAKTRVSWLDDNAVVVDTDFGPGSLTKSGYPRVAKLWRRGTPLSAATALFEGQESDVSAGVQVDHSVQPARLISTRSVDFWTQEVSVRKPDNNWQRLAVPSHATTSIKGDWLYVQPRRDWEVNGRLYLAGSLLVAPLAQHLAGQQTYQVLFTPTAGTSLGSYVVTRRHVILNLLDHVNSRLVEWEMPAGLGPWRERQLASPVAGSGGSLNISTWFDGASRHTPFADAYTVNHADFLSPDSYWLATAGGDRQQLLKQLPARFDATDMRSVQHFAASKDGTQVPYFVVYPKGFKPNQPAPTLMYGYGGFRIAQRPFYSSTWGSAWLARGGVVVVANIRGGGEYGPAWHRAALRDKRQNSFDDFVAIGEDLIRRGITTPAQLGIYGGSNGGLLTAAVAVQRPELFGAVVSAVPLLDMRRYHLLPAGDSWVAEYGNPDLLADWQFISAYSPYHNLKVGVKYPRMLFTTSTRDDRVHPAHARKMVARLLAMGVETLYFENIEGGHSGAADIGQRAELSALQFSYLWKQLTQP